jgi:hypothetical protein
MHGPEAHPPVGVRNPNDRVEMSEPIPKNMPRFIIPLDLPVFPGTAPWTKAVPSYMAGSESGSIYIKSAVAAYVSTRNPLSIMAWYSTALTHCGFSLDFFSKGGPQEVEEINYNWNGGGGISIDMTFAPRPDGRTLILYMTRPRSTARSAHGPHTSPTRPRRSGSRSRHLLATYCTRVSLPTPTPSTPLWMP